MKVSPYSFKGATLFANYMTAVSGMYHTAIRLPSGAWFASPKYNKVITNKD
jgi:hypothetical protein